MKRQIIIVEGIDHLHKSTFINELTERIKSRGKKVFTLQKYMPSVLDSTVKKNSIVFEKRHLGVLECAISFFNSMIHSRYLDDTIVILDRFHSSQFAYGVALRSNNVISEFGNIENLIKINNNFEDELMKLFEKCTLVTFCLKEGSSADADGSLSSADLMKVNYEFKRYSRKTKLQNAQIDLTINPKNFHVNTLEYLDKVESLIEY